MKTWEDINENGKSILLAYQKSLSVTNPNDDEKQESNKYI